MFHLFSSQYHSFQPAEPKGGQGLKRPRHSEDNHLRKQREIEICKIKLRDCEHRLSECERALYEREHRVSECERALYEREHRLSECERALYERERQISDLISKNKKLKGMLSDKESNLLRLGKQEHNSRKEKRQSQENLRRERAKSARMEEQLQKINEERKDEQLEEEPDINNGRDKLTEKQLRTIIKEQFTKIASKRRSTSLSLKEFVTVVYYPYSEGAFGKVSDILLLEDFTGACEEDEATDRISCNLNEHEICSIITSHWNQGHLDHILGLFRKYKHSSYVLQRLWDMGYHQAKDVVRGLEKSQIGLFKPKHALMKSKIFGKDGKLLAEKTCFVSGENQNGVGDHVSSSCGNRHITGCYGGNSQWNLVSVISALNQPYKTCILYDIDKGVFIKTSLDYTTLVPYGHFPMSELHGALNGETFNDVYQQIKQNFQDQPFSATIKQKHWYLQEEEVRRTKEIVHNNCTLIRDKEHLLEILEITEKQITFLLDFPKLKRWDGVEMFINELLVNDFVRGILERKLQNPKVFLETLCKQGTKTQEENDLLVPILMPLGIKCKKKYTLNECREIILKMVGLYEDIEKMKSCNAIPLLNWLKIKQSKGLYVVSDAYDIWLKLQLWEYYVNRVKGSPKMFWKMSQQDFKIIEDSLRAGVKSIDRATQEFIASLVERIGNL